MCFWENQSVRNLHVMRSHQTLPYTKKYALDSDHPLLECARLHQHWPQIDSCFCSPLCGVNWLPYSRLKLRVCPRLQKVSWLDTTPRSSNSVLSALPPGTKDLIIENGDHFAGRIWMGKCVSYSFVAMCLWGLGVWRVSGNRVWGLVFLEVPSLQPKKFIAESRIIFWDEDPQSWLIGCSDCTYVADSISS